MQSVRYSWYILMKFEFSQHIFERRSNIKYQKIRPVRAELFHPTGRMDRHDEAKCRFSQFCERAWKKNRPIEDLSGLHLVFCSSTGTNTKYPSSVYEISQTNVNHHTCCAVRSKYTPSQISEIQRLCTPRYSCLDHNISHRTSRSLFSLMTQLNCRRTNNSNLH